MKKEDTPQIKDAARAHSPLEEWPSATSLTPPSRLEEPVSALSIQEGVEQEIKLQVARALSHTKEVHPCAACDRRTDYDGDCCRPCQKAGNTASPLHQIGRRMGYRNGIPIDLLEILGLPDSELLLLDQNELAELFDKNTTHRVPALLADHSFVSGNDLTLKTVPIVWKEIRSHERPPTAQERDAALQQKEETARRQEHSSKELAQERSIERAKQALVEALKVVV